MNKGYSKNLKSHINGFIPKNKILLGNNSTSILEKLYLFSNSDNKFLRFFFSSRLNLVLILEILSSGDKGRSFEYLCDRIPNQIGKRTTIQNCLNSALHQKIVSKVTCSFDKRIKYFRLTEFSSESLKKLTDAF